MEYELRTETLQDIVENVPQERLPDLFNELHQLTNQLYMAKAMTNLMSLVAEAAGGGVDAPYPETITWKDDGKGEIGVQMVDGESDKVFATIGMGSEDEGDINEQIKGKS
tara:strand:+ start:1651 stop:1980 length:330 start_codon:yes stop_codon:yes gene_type:complete